MGVGMGVGTQMRAADIKYVVMLIASFETVLPLDVLENLKIHAQNGRVLRHVADDGDGTFEKGGEVGLGEPGVAW